MKMVSEGEIGKEVGSGNAAALADEGFRPNGEQLRLPALPSEGEQSVGEALRFLWRSLSGKRRRHFYLTLMMLLLGAVAELVTIGAVLPFLGLIADPESVNGVPGMRGFMELVGARAPQEMVVAAASLVIAAAIFGALVRLALIRVNLRFILWLGHDIGMTVFARMLRQPYSYFVMRNSSEVLSSVEKVQTVIWSILSPVMQGFIGAVMSLAIIILLFIIDPLSATISAAIMALAYIAVSLAVSRRLRANSERLARTATQRVQTIREGLGGIRDVLLEQSQEVFESKFRRVDYDYRRAQVVTFFITTAPRFVIEAIGISLLILLALYLCGRPGGLLSALPILGALALGAQRLLPLVQQAYMGWSSFQGNRQMLLDVVELMRMPVVTSAPRDRKVLVAAFHQSVELRRVGFQYPTRQYAVRNVELVIQKGARIGFVGETGSGKSTLLDLVMGLLEPSEGAILIDGEKLDDTNRAIWQAQIAHVPQTIYLSDSSIVSNIAFGEPAEEVDMDRVREAARMAHIDEFIIGLEEGYDTFVGERGVRLSGGQRQRIGIARALYKCTPVLIFDEATSALDGETESAIMDSIGALGNDVTLLIVAHRTTTLARCDLVVRLGGGRVVETGSYQDVLVKPARSAAADRI